MIDSGLIVDSIMARLAQNALDAYEVFYASSKGLTLEIKDGVLDVFVAAENVGLSIRALKGQRLGFAYCTNLSSGAVSDLVDRVVQGTSSTDPDPFVGFPSPSEKAQPLLEQFDCDLATIPVEKKIDRARSLEAAARSCDQRIKKVRKAGYNETAGTITICNDTGLKRSYEKTFVSGSVLVVAEDGEGAEMGWDYGFSPFFDQLDMEAIGATAARRAISMLGARPLTSMHVPAILPPWVASDVLKVLSASFMADNVQKGKSILVGRLGESIFSPHVTIVDDGLYSGGMASSPFDDEGSLHERSVLVSEGIVQGLLYDQYTANKENRHSTGNAGRRGITAPPTVQGTNFYIKSGSSHPDELLSSVDAGLMITDIMGLHTADPISGDFSVGAAGLWIEKGKTAFPVKGVAVSGNLVTLFASVDGVGSDLKFYGPSGSPTLRVSDLNIAGCGS
ncbi:MAG: TldD/PmbA family protein [Deltaproteobacteria bacterium]|nr:TldD/PmbA family protein [Deltaproteobacteria bacterium]